MDNVELSSRFATLTTAHLADACVRLSLPVRCAPAGLVALLDGSHVAGRALPAQHVGSVDVFLEAYERASAGDILVVDNRGRLDEACVGDLAALEALSAGLAGIVIWGLHRDTTELREIGLPVYSLGALPVGPLSAGERPADALDRAVVGDWDVTPDDLVFADSDGVLFVPRGSVEAVLAAAEGIRDTERRQAALILSGTSLRDQVGFVAFLEARATDPTLTFRQHLQNVGGAIEV